MGGTPEGQRCHTHPGEFAERPCFRAEKARNGVVLGAGTRLAEGAVAAANAAWLTEDRMSYRNRTAVGLACLALGMVGCSSARDVEVSGKVTAPSSLTVGDKVVIDFIDVVGVGSDATQSVAHTTQLASVGDFKETVALEGDQVLIRAIDDRDGNGACSAGEAWGETQAEVIDGKAVATDVALASTACPVVIADE